MLRALITAVVGALSRLYRAYGLAPWITVVCVILWPFLSRAPNNLVSDRASEVLLPSVIAALESAASATGATLAASIAFPTLASKGLKADPMFKDNWQRVAKKAKQSSAVREEFYKEIRFTHRRLVYILGAIDDAGKRLRNPDNNPVKDEGSWFQWWQGDESKLGPEQMKLQRTVRHFSDLLQQSSSAYARFQEDINSLDLALSTIALQNGETSKNPSHFFGKGIMNLNARFDSNAANPSSASCEKGEKCETGNGAISPDDPEAALFIHNLRRAHSAGSLFHGSFLNAKAMLEMVAEAMKKQAKWAGSTERILGKVSSSLCGKMDQEELLMVMEEVARLAEEWRVMIQESFLNKDE